MKILIKNKFLIVLLIVLIMISLYKFELSINILNITGKSLRDMLILLPPIFILIGLLDKWIERGTLVKYMGENSGVSGIFFSLILATVAAGPLYMAFPIAILLINKGAGLRYIIFFLGAWSSVKLPVLIYEFSSFGIKFSLIHIIFSLVFYYLTGILFEKIFTPADISKIKKISDNY
ncbi:MULTISPECIES: permease [Vagococcus]|uniref:Permease n=1 Tax=Vagococcus fluvialis bH819 TaxID=1255619 RepID=A0A1X6WR55_9ENTE|nr:MULTISPECIES: permease [Vagococcus]SLM86757.1 hypothetical protein FM121_11720 [Vagococcus fluvialis bH819]HCM88783.1 hypothetical protein [Vagococcus sp.]